ncbi:LytR C-terminal domain-containing protein [Phytoactinopolyspora limicola]|uniref:LytR C-terminal domain-containing protein n=1 Tax=Phytoactinopolyspora limicola TaxID=2715536 RepID=UPI00140B1417|nr:LytR C-terminal domain-containing protein [Phytoactinopolyspora limicola]
MDADEPTEEYEDSPRHTWRHVRTAVTLLILVGFVVGAAWYSWNNVLTGDDDEAAPRAAPTCVPVAPTDAPDPEAIELNVYNATQRGGLARDVAAAMRERGFTILDVANDPLERSVDGTAEVRSHEDQRDAATLVASLVPDAVIVADERSSETVDLVLGNDFEELASDPEPDQTLQPCD